MNPNKFTLVLTREDIQYIKQGLRLLNESYDDSIIFLNNKIFRENDRKRIMMFSRDMDKINATRKEVAKIYDKINILKED